MWKHKLACSDWKHEVAWLAMIWFHRQHLVRDR
jgi:hypothetical protein